MASESQNNAEICIEEDSLDHENTKANNTQVKNKYEAEDSAARTAAADTETKAAAIDITVETEAEVQVKSTTSNTESAETSDTRVKTAENKTVKQADGGNCWSFMAAILPTQGLTLNIDNGSYYANLPADMKTGWIKIGSTWNYFDTSGRMLI